MHDCCRRRLHSSARIGRDLGSAAVAPAVIRGHQNAKLRPRRPAERMRERSRTLRELDELQGGATSSICPEPHLFLDAMATTVHQILRAALIRRRV